MASKERKFAKRYARMLFNVTGVKKAEEAIQGLTLVSEAIEESKDVRNFFLSPLIDEDERAKAVEVLAEKLGLGEEVKKFLVFLSLKKAIVALPDIIRHYRNIYFEKKRKAKATVITPIKFNGDYEKRLVESLRKITDRDVDIEYVYDPDLIGGIVVKVGSTMFDGSLRGQLRMLKESLSA